MELRRTANAGVLLKLDGVSILLDGVCREVKPYPATPPEERALLAASWPDVVAFTHAHKDHYDPTFAAQYQQQTGGVVLGPQGLPGVKTSMESTWCFGVKITPVSCRHIGAAGRETPHSGFIIEGTKTIWFLGDSAPTQWRGRSDLPIPDVLIIPYAYANTTASWAITTSFHATEIILLHMPERAHDEIGLWDAVETTTNGDSRLRIPAMCSEIHLG